MKQAAVSRLHFPVTTLGPGRRVGLWLQGCSIRCPGCISLDTWDPRVGLVPIADLLERIDQLAWEADGLTVSGGEPFDPGDLVDHRKREGLAGYREVGDGEHRDAELAGSIGRVFKFEEVSAVRRVESS